MAADQPDGPCLAGWRIGRRLGKPGVHQAITLVGGGAGHAFTRHRLAAVGCRIQAALQDKLVQHPHYGPAVDPLRLYAAYRWLRVCDRLSLALCSDIIPSSDAIDEVPRDSWTEYITIQYQRPEPFKLILDPFPFAQPTVQLTIQMRHLDQASYSSQTSYWAAIKRAPWLQQTVTVTAA